VSTVPDNIGDMAWSILGYGAVCLVAGWVVGYLCGGR
jgi:hypothetical protein